MCVPVTLARRFTCKALFFRVVMLGSTQRSLPCEVRSILSWFFAAVQKLLQISKFSLTGYRECSPSFVWVSVLRREATANLATGCRNNPDTI